MVGWGGGGVESAKANEALRCMGHEGMAWTGRREERKHEQRIARQDRKGGMGKDCGIRCAPQKWHSVR